MPCCDERYDGPDRLKLVCVGSSQCGKSCQFFIDILFFNTVFHMSDIFQKCDFKNRPFQKAILENGLCLNGSYVANENTYW